MEWFKEKPSQNGIYWFRGIFMGIEHQALLVEVYSKGIPHPKDAPEAWWSTNWWGSVWNHDGYTPVAWDNWRGEWAGPIEEPK